MEIKMKGQEKAASQARLWAETALARIGKQPIRPALIHGPAGCGKSHLISLLCREMTQEGIEIVRLPSATECFRTIADFEGNFKVVLERQKPVVIVLDEAQAMSGGAGLSAPVCRGFRSALYAWGEREPEHSVLPFGKEPMTVDWRNIALVLATNQPGQLEDRASIRLGEFPFRRRLFGISLEEYSSDVIGEVISDFLAARGLRAAPCSAGLIARCHRGTLEAIGDVVERYRGMFPDHPVMSKERVLEAIKLTDWFPRGISRTEIRCLVSLEGSPVSKVSLPSRVSADSAALKVAVSYLEGQATNGVSTPFVMCSGTTVRVTDNGRKYLAALRREGFTV